VIKRLLIANRGEIAVRICHAARELGIETIAVYSDADADARHVRTADRAVRIGQAAPSESYLNVPRIVDAARTAGADAVHPGYGFLSENPALPRACAAAGLVFVGPSADAIEKMGSKIEARRLVSAAGVAVVPGETPGDQSDAGLQAAAERVGFPVLIKASAGGGGRGMRGAANAREVPDAVRAARREAIAAFGEGTLYVERLVERPRHVEVQVFGDAARHVIHLFERECSVQRRHQKVIEESPSPIVTPDLRTRMTDAAVNVARAVEYRNAGTIEFLVDGQSFYFLEMNTRLQVEHPVTEQVTGVDLVRAQLLVASGEPLPWTEAQVSQRGHAIEARIYAEDPANGFLPQAGRLLRYREPEMPGVRIDSGVTEGATISVHYDPMIAKVIATAETRRLAITRLSNALREFEIDGLRTNIPFLLALLARSEFRDAAIDTGFLDRETIAIPQSLNKSSILNPPSTVSYDPWDGARAAASAPRSEPARRRARSGGVHQVTAPMPAMVIKIHVTPGDAVKKGDTILVLEAMKMELPVRAPGDARVKAICCQEGELVAADAVLVEFE
jgi:3-methylcrotonyl-CoA carboxylase alpha subunit